LLGECCKFSIHESIASKDYYRLGGHGTVSMRYDFRTLRTLEKLGLIEQKGGWRATEKGRKAFEQSQPKTI
jgi:hypothetical protein